MSGGQKKWKRKEKKHCTPVRRLGTFSLHALWAEFTHAQWCLSSPIISPVGRFDWWKKKSCFIWEKRWSSITFGYKYSSIKWTTHHHRFTVIAIIVALEGWQKGGGGVGGVDLSYRKSGANMTRKGEAGSSRGEWGAGLDHNQANGTLILPSPLCGHRDNVGSRLPGFTVCSSQPLSYSLRHSRCKNNKKKKKTSMKVLNPRCQTLCLHDVCSSIGYTRLDALLNRQPNPSCIPGV